jgi:serine/threonine protein kinase
MNQPPDPAPEGLPPRAEDAILADFLDEALDGLARGEPVSINRLRSQAPELVEQGQRLLEKMKGVAEAAGVLVAQAILTQSDMLAEAGNGERTPENHEENLATEALPNPFPGEFRFCRRLGSGAFGTVWLADDLHLGRPVAIKTICQAGSAAGAADRLARLRDEARLLAAVRHRNVVQVHAWREKAAPSSGSETNPAHYLVLQFVPGGSLAERVREEGPLSWQLAARYIADVTEGLIEVHERGILHRDVKPANILWDPVPDEALLTDFGVSARLVNAGSVAGTPFYMPPEAFQGCVGPAQDVYGLAASLFWLVTGSVPFPGPTSAEIIAQASRGLPDPDPRGAGLPRVLDRLIRDGLAAEPRRRPALREFASALRGALNQLLADDLLRPPVSSPPGSVSLRLTVSRQVDRYAFLPVATTRPLAERFVRDMRRVPREPERVDLRTGDRVRLEVETDRDGFVTVFNVGPTGNLNLLYPANPAYLARPTAVKGGQPLQVLEIELTPPTGQERLFALWSRQPVPFRLDELRNLAEQGELPVSPSYGATRDMVLVQESIRQLKPEDWRAVVLELNHLPCLENVR